ncbi:diacylglycerol kinase family protein [Listeria kieliensis]|uniref:Diacylglycerol kinase n=1 Tax=Listeria kieliensis TaxID=1621700 RepID=A0A3D8TV42_9LIST|nr:diacylglycerol kinase family protein [Listeria kieliensis]RDX02659.1 diacylglycerol kinase [Listeria kieliensis]
MLMASNDRKYKRSRSYFASFKHAFCGIKTTLKEERNMKIHVASAVLVLLFATLFQVKMVEWLVLLLCIGLVIALETVNTAIERTIDTITEEFLPEAKKAKDAAAGAVLIVATISAIIGLIIFIPYFWQLFHL